MGETAERTRIPVTVLTGFLGAGKTTLLNRVLGGGFRDTAVIVNEYGDVPIDGDLVEGADERAFALTTGCLCCTAAGDVRLTLLRLAEEAETGRGPLFRRLVIETTGLADPAPVLHALMTNDLVIERYALNGVVAVIDAVAGGETLDRFEEARRQAATADLILLSKTDLSRPEAAAALEERLRAMNPNARLMPAPQVGPNELFGLAAFDPALKPPSVADWLRFDARPRGAHGHGHDGGDHEGRGPESDVAAFCFAGAEPLGPWDVQDAMEALQEALGRDLLRIKAIARLDEDPDRPVALHVVQHVLHPPTRLAAWSGPPQTRMVVIARGPRRHETPAIVGRFLPSLTPVAAEAAPATA